AELKKGKALEQRAKRESDRLQTLLNHTLEGVITIDETGIIQNFNAASVRLFGYQPEEIIGQNITQLMPAQHRKNHEHGMSRFLSSEQSTIIGQPIELGSARVFCQIQLWYCLGPGKRSHHSVCSSQIG
ncbi:MAG: PAS domain-containing protein, partial [Desulfobacteraceae bacterium]